MIISMSLVNVVSCYCIMANAILYSRKMQRIYHKPDIVFKTRC